MLGNSRAILTVLKEVDNFIDNKRLTYTLREKYSNTEFFWSVFSCIQSEYRNKKKHEYLTERREFNKLKLKYDRRNKHKIGNIMLTVDDKCKP